MERICDPTKAINKILFPFKRVHKAEGTVTSLHQRTARAPVNYRDVVIRWLSAFKVYQKTSVMPFFAITWKRELNKQRKTIITEVSEAVQLETKEFFHIQPH